MLGPLRGKKSDERVSAGLRRKALKELTHFTLARRLESPDDRLRFDVVGARLLRPGDIVFVLAEDMIPADGVVVDGIARVDESTMVGPGEPVLRSAAADSCEVAAGTRVVAGWLVVRVSADARDCLLRRLVQGEPE